MSEERTLRTPVSPFATKDRVPSSALIGKVLARALRRARRGVGRGHGRLLLRPDPGGSPAAVGAPDHEPPRGPGRVLPLPALDDRLRGRCGAVEQRPAGAHVLPALPTAPARLGRCQSRRRLPPGDAAGRPQLPDPRPAGQRQVHVLRPAPELSTRDHPAGRPGDRRGRQLRDLPGGRAAGAELVAPARRDLRRGRPGVLRRLDRRPPLPPAHRLPGRRDGAAAGAPQRPGGGGVRRHRRLGPGGSGPLLGEAVGLHRRRVEEPVRREAVQERHEAPGRERRLVGPGARRGHGLRADRSGGRVLGHPAGQLAVAHPRLRQPPDHLQHGPGAPGLRRCVPLRGLRARSWNPQLARHHRPRARDPDHPLLRRRQGRAPALPGAARLGGGPARFPAPGSARPKSGAPRSPSGARAWPTWSATRIAARECWTALRRLCHGSRRDPSNGA